MHLRGSESGLRRLRCVRSPEMYPSGWDTLLEQHAGYPMAAKMGLVTYFKTTESILSYFEVP